MPRYFFHVEDGADLPDLKGTELPNIAEARREAARFAGMLLAEQSETFWNDGQWNLRVTDETDLTLFQLSFVATQSPATLNE